MTRAGTAAFIVENIRWLSAGILLSFLSSFGQTFFISIFAGEIRAEFGLSHGGWGGLYSLGTALSALVMIWAGTLTDRFRVRALSPVVLCGLAVACFAVASNRSFLLLPVIVFALRFFGQGMCMHITAVAMVRWFVATRGRALAISALGYSAGEALLPLAFVNAMARVDWHILWVFCGIVCLLGIPVLSKLLTQERTPQSMAQDLSSTGMQNRHWTRLEAIRHPLFWFLVPALLGPSAFVTALFFHQVHLAEIKGWTHTGLVALFPAFTSMSILAALGTGWALDKWGTRALMPVFQVPLAIGFVCLSLTFSLRGGLVGFLFLALGIGANATLPSAFWAEYYGTGHIGAIKAMAVAIMVLGSAIGPGLTGVLLDFGIGLETQFLAIAVYFVAVCISVELGLSRLRVAA
ncbi:MAG: MFS transporter [Pseudomonadota bacterium]